MSTEVWIEKEPVSTHWPWLLIITEVKALTRRVIDVTEILTVIYLLTFIKGLIGCRVSFKIKIVQVVCGLLGPLFEDPHRSVTVPLGYQMFPYCILLIVRSNQYIFPFLTERFGLSSFKIVVFFSVWRNSWKGYAVEDFQQKDMAIMSLSSFQPMVIYMTPPLLR